MLADRVLLAPGSGPTQDAEPPSSPTSDVGPPMVVSPGDPEWAEILAEEEQARQTLRRGPSGR